MIDHASRRDLPQILAIYNEVIRNSTAVFSDEEFTPSRGETWFDAKMERHILAVAVIRPDDTIGLAFGADLSERD